jgi:flagellar motor protein MotB
MRITSLGALAASLLLAGCASERELNELKARNAELAFRADVADKATTRAEGDKRLAQREAELLREDARLVREKLALANDALRDVKKDVDEELKARLAELQAKAPTKQELSPWGGVVLESGILFAPGRHELTADGEKALGPMVESLASSKYEGWVVELSGHTDSDPIKATAKVYADNHELGARRANSVRRFLIAKGVPVGRLYLSAWGETRPLGPETTPAGKAANRRVEIRLHKQVATEHAGAVRGSEAEPKPASAPRTDEAPKDETPKDEAAKSDASTEETEGDGH